MAGVTENLTSPVFGIPELYNLGNLASPVPNYLRDRLVSPSVSLGEFGIPAETCEVFFIMTGTTITLN